MTKRDIADVALKMIGIYMLILALESLIGLAKSTTYFLDPTADDANEDLIYLITNSFRTGLYAFGFWLLAFKTERVSKFLIKTDSDKTSFSVDKADMLQILFCVAGILITFYAISGFWSSITMATTWDYNRLPENYRTAIYAMQIGVPTTKAVIGLILIFLSSTFARLLSKKKRKTVPNKS